MTDFKFNLDSQVKDNHTGFKGVVAKSQKV